MHSTNGMEGIFFLKILLLRRGHHGGPEWKKNVNFSEKFTSHSQLGQEFKSEKFLKIDCEMDFLELLEV